MLDDVRWRIHKNLGFRRMTSNNTRSKLYKTHYQQQDDLHPGGKNPRCLPGQMPIQKASENMGKHLVTNSWEVVSHSSDNVVTMVQIGSLFLMSPTIR